MMRPFFSIVIPTLNSAKTIVESLQSVLAQDFRDLEIVVLDGGSSDGTTETIASLARADPRIRLHCEKDSGIYDAMNRGMGHAKGQWLYFMGGDDTLSNEAVLRRAQAQASDHKVMYGNVKVVGNAAWAADGSIYDGPFTLQKLFMKNICHQAIFYRKDFVDASVGRFLADYRTCADWDFNLRCRAKSDFWYLGMTVADFRAGGQSTTNPDDSAFGHGFVERSLKLFGLSAFDPSVTAGFSTRAELAKLQRREDPARYYWQRVAGKLASWAARS